MDSSVRLAMRKRNRLLKLCCKSKTRASWEKYRQQRNFTTTLIRKNKAKYFHKVNAKLQDVTTGVKAWWSIVKRFYGEKMQSTVSTLIEGVRQVTNAQEKAEILNEYFKICDQTKVDDRFASLPSDPSSQNNVILSNVFTTEREVHDPLKTVDVSKACGPDGIGNRILKP